jgi:hypothetical protein
VDEGTTVNYRLQTNEVTEIPARKIRPMPIWSVGGLRSVIVAADNQGPLAQHVTRFAGRRHVLAGIRRHGRAINPRFNIDRGGRTASLAGITFRVTDR